METDLKSVQFHLTNKCNLNCIFCWRAYGNNQSLKDLPDDKFINLCQDAVEMKPEEITISGGGEPLIRKNLFLKLIYRIKSEDIRGNLITNGTLLDERTCKRMVEENWDEVIFSIQGYNQKMDDWMRGRRGSYKRTIEAVRRLKRIRDKNDKPSIRFQVVLTKDNSRNLPGYIELAKEMNIDIVNFRLVNEIGENLSPRIDENFKKEIKECEDKAKEYSIDFRREFSFEEREAEKKCRKPFEEMVIFADGRVAPCCVYFDEVDNELLDNVAGKNLKRLWQGKKMKAFRRKFETGKIPERCRQCLGPT